jgi:hypothetical protein
VCCLRIWHLLVVLLLFSPFLLPVVHSQSYVTVTTQITTVQVMTTTSQLQQIFNSAFTINATTSSSSCQIFHLAFNVTQGQVVSGNFTSDVPLGFFITQDSNYQTWLNSGGCASFPASTVSQPPTTSFAFNPSLSSSGLWEIVLVNYSTTRNADGFMTAYLSSFGSTFTETLLSTVTQTNQTQSVMTTSATTVTPGIPGFPAESIIIGIILGLAAVIFLRRYRNTV